MTDTLLTAPPLDLDNLGSWVPQLTEEEVHGVVGLMAPWQREEFFEKLEEFMAQHAGAWTPHPHQIPPPLSEDWFGWLLMAGRGAGKTAAVTHWLDDHANGPPCFPGRVPHMMGIIAPTFGDASASVVHGKDGLAVINPQVREGTIDGVRVVKWPNGSFAYLFGVNTVKDVNRLPAKGNRCADLREEIAAWPYLKDGMDQADLGLRIGLARWVGATTPRSRPTIRRLNNDPMIRVTKARTSDNPSLGKRHQRRLYEQFGNTRLGVQELDGEILESIEGALWEQDLIDQYRVGPQDVPKLIRVRTYVDPSWGTTNDECGIIVCGLGVDRHVYVLGDLSKRTGSNEWGKLAALGYMPERWQLKAATHPDPTRRVRLLQRDWFGRPSEKVVAEGNFQAEQVKNVMALTETQIGRRVRFGLAYASKGKRLRAEPVELAYEQGRVHHVGRLEKLEFQLTNWVPPDTVDVGDDAGDPPQTEEGEDGEQPSKWSPDRLDAVVFGVTDLLLGKGSGVGRLHVAEGRVPPTTPSRQAEKPAPAATMLPQNTIQRRMAERQLQQREDESRDS